MILSGYRAGCKTVGGVKNFYLINKRERKAAIELKVVSGVLTFIGSGVNAYKIYPRESNWSFSQPRSVDGDGAIKYDPTLSGVFHGYTSELVVLNYEMGLGLFEVFIVMNDGTLIYAGIDENGMRVTGGDGGSTGISLGESIGSTIDLSGEAVKPAPIVETMAEFEAAFTVVNPVIEEVYIIAQAGDRLIAQDGDLIMA